jgi:hypothetical protein
VLCRTAPHCDELQFDADRLLTRRGWFLRLGNQKGYVFVSFRVAGREAAHFRLRKILNVERQSQGIGIFIGKP